jgi:hypothetical protein
MSNVSEWEISAANNTSPPPDGAPEGMPPSTVNDVMREMMAAVARWYQDSRGGLVSTGSGSAYVVATNAIHAALNDVSILVFRAHTANTGAVTLNVDALGAKSIRSGGAALVAGQIPTNSLVAVAYNPQIDAFDLLTNVPVSVNTSNIVDKAVTYAKIQDVTANKVLGREGTGGTVAEIDMTAAGRVIAGAADAAAQRTALGLGALSLLNSPLPVANGGTGSTTESGARTALGLEYANASETLAGSSSTKGMTPAGFAGNKDHSTNGYYRFPGGFTLQWGIRSVGANTTASVTFPVAFANACVNVVVSEQRTTTTQADGRVGVGNLSTTGCTMVNGFNGSQNFYWQAIGY